MIMKLIRIHTPYIATVLTERPSPQQLNKAKNNYNEIKNNVELSIK